MTVSHSLSLEECKIKATRLRKQLKSDNDEQALQAAARFQRLSQWSALSAHQLVERKDQIRHRHALAVIALENNFASWAELKHQLARREQWATGRRGNQYTLLYQRQCEVFLNVWYRCYEEARAHLEQRGGYLLPYKEHFFICERPYVQALGLDPDDPDWQGIGWDWQKPANQESWARLYNKLVTRQSSLHG